MSEKREVSPAVPAIWKIFAGLLIIFLSGTGLGYVVGARSGGDFATPDSVVPPSGTGAAWTERAIAGLTQSLDLTETQLSLVRPIVERRGGKVHLGRERALFQIYLELLDLHDEISPLLDEAQQKKLAKSRKKMQLTIRQRFQSFIDDEPTAHD